MCSIKSRSIFLQKGEALGSIGKHSCFVLLIKDRLAYCMLLLLFLEGNHLVHNYWLIVLLITGWLCLFMIAIVDSKIASPTISIQKRILISIWIWILIWIWIRGKEQEIQIIGRGEGEWQKDYKYIYEQEEEEEKQEEKEEDL